MDCSVITSSRAVARWLSRLGVPMRDPGSEAVSGPTCVLIGEPADLDLLDREASQHMLEIVVSNTPTSLAVPFPVNQRRYEPRTMRHILEMVLDLGRIVGLPERAMEHVADGERRLQAVIDASDREALSRLRVLPLLSIDPIVGAGRWISDMIQKAGGTPVGILPGEEERRLDHHELIALQPDVLIPIANSESTPDLRTRMRRLVAEGAWPDVPAIRKKQVLFFDGEVHFLEPGPEIVTTCIRLNSHLQKMTEV